MNNCKYKPIRVWDWIWHRLTHTHTDYRTHRIYSLCISCMHNIKYIYMWLHKVHKHTIRGCYLVYVCVCLYIYINIYIFLCIGWVLWPFLKKGCLPTGKILIDSHENLAEHNSRISSNRSALVHTRAQSNFWHALRWR